MRISVGSDEKTHLTDSVLAEFERRGVEVELHSALSPEGCEGLWPQVGYTVGKRIASGACEEGILFCGRAPALASEFPYNVGHSQAGQGQGCNHYHWCSGSVIKEQTRCGGALLTPCDASRVIGSKEHTGNA